MALILLRAFRHRESKHPTVKRLRFGCVQILAASERHRERRQPAVPVAPRGSDTSGLCRVLVLARTSKRRIRDPQAISDFELRYHQAMRVRSSGWRNNPILSTLWLMLRPSERHVQLGALLELFRW